MDVFNIAEICHEANRAYCQLLHDFSQTHWNEAPRDVQRSTVNGVEFIFDNPSAKPEHAHLAWVTDKKAQGWKYGPRINPTKKEHPCMVPYENLPIEQRRKDKLFLAIVLALKD